jgi:hypothetical protein
MQLGTEEEIVQALDKNNDDLKYTVMNLVHKMQGVSWLTK